MKQRSRRASVAVVAMAALAIVPTTVACGGEDRATPEAAAPDAPITTVAGLERGSIALSDPDSTTVVAFVASWCAPCRRELPELERLAGELGDRARFVAVAVQEAPEQTRQLVEQTGITFAVGSDPDGVALDDYGFTGLPGTMLVDPSGAVVHRYRGTIDFDDLTRRLGAVAG